MRLAQDASAPSYSGQMPQRGHGRRNSATERPYVLGGLVLSECPDLLERHLCLDVGWQTLVVVR